MQSTRSASQRRRGQESRAAPLPPAGAPRYHREEPDHTLPQGQINTNSKCRTKTPPLTTSGQSGRADRAGSQADSSSAARDKFRASLLKFPVSQTPYFPPFQSTQQAGLVQRKRGTENETIQQPIPAGAPFPSRRAAGRMLLSLGNFPTSRVAGRFMH